MKSWSPNHAQSLVLVIVLSFVIEYLVFGPYLTRSNDLMFAFGGDALILYYDTLYHVCHDQSYWHLGATNYPYGDSIIMTDAQAGFSILLKFVHENIYPIGHLIPGFVHSFIMLLLPLTAIYLFLIFKKLKVENTFSIIGSLLVAFLAPQVIRILGHFGLAYPFLIPMAMYWFMTKYENPSWKWSDLLYGLVILFFFINNPYVGFIAVSTFLLASVFLLLSRRFEQGWSILFAGAWPLLIGYLILKISDPFNDRIEQQWGFFYQFTNLDGLFFPKDSLLHDLLSYFFPHIPGSRFEGRVNVGLVTTMTLALYLMYWLYNKVMKRKTFGIPVELKFLFLASLVLYIYAANYSLYGFAQPFLEEHLGPLLMFKASGRLAWSIYYFLTIFTVYLLYHFYKGNHNYFGISIVVIAFLLWAWEDKRVLTKRFSNFQFENKFTKELNANHLESMDLEIEEYQAIYLLPVAQVWHDKITFKLYFETQYPAIMLSAESGLPIINGMLSRSPTYAAYTSIQLAAHPIIHRERIKDLQADKKILLLLDKSKQKPSIGEQYLIDQADYIGDFLGVGIYETTPGQMQGWTSPPPAQSSLYMHESFSSESSPYTLVGNGAKTITKENAILWEGNLPDTLANQEMLELSIWYYADNTSYKLPDLRITVNGKSKAFYNRSSRDFIGYWVRQSVTFPGTNKIVLEANCDIPMIFDEMHIKSSDANTKHEENDIQFWNGYPLLNLN